LKNGIIKEYFQKSSMVYFLLGCFCGALGWVYGQSSYPTIALKYGAGFSLLSVCTIGVAAILLGYSVYTGKPIGIVSRFITNRSITVSIKITTTFFGLGLVAFFCWLITGSQNALGTFALSSIIIFSFIYFAWGINSLKKIAKM
jgi:hypothetical protein